MCVFLARGIFTERRVRAPLERGEASQDPSGISPQAPEVVQCEHVVVVEAEVLRASHESRVVARAEDSIGLGLVEEARVVRAHGVDRGTGREGVEQAAEHDAVPQALAERLSFGASGFSGAAGQGGVRGAGTRRVANEDEIFPRGPSRAEARVGRALALSPLVSRRWPVVAAIHVLSIPRRATAWSPAVMGAGTAPAAATRAIGRAVCREGRSPGTVSCDF